MFRKEVMLALCRCGYWPFAADVCTAMRLIGLRRKGQRVVSAPRRPVLSASPFKLRRRASRRHLELVAAPPSSLSSLTLVREQSRLGRSLKRSGDVVFSVAVLGLGSPLFLLLAVLVKLSSPVLTWLMKPVRAAGESSNCRSAPTSMAIMSSYQQPSRRSAFSF